MHIHIAGIGGTFMGGLALLARALGHRVTGSDAGLYPPMSTQLAAQGIEVADGYDPRHLEPVPDEVIIGNALSRGNALVEAVLARDLPYRSGPAWLAEHVLRGRHVLAVAGTHGKTTTASLLAWMLERAGLEPGFLIGGVPENFGISARLGAGRLFVVEADEYDTAFFDKRSKFVHYRPRTLVLNNIEFDHADIFPDLEAIKRQFHHLLRTVPGNGRVIANADDPVVAEVLARGCWTPVESFTLAQNAADWRAASDDPGWRRFTVHHGGAVAGEAHSSLTGRHNAANALAALAAAHHAGVAPAAAAAALAEFRSARRRLQLLGAPGGIHVYDDFAHHPTAIRVTLEAGRVLAGRGRLVAVLEPRSNTMRMGVHRGELAAVLAGADAAYLYQPPDMDWDVAEVVDRLDGRGQRYTDIEGLVAALARDLRPGDHVVIMSNGAFGGIHARLLERLGA